MTLDRKYEIAREQIRHEDGLINNRTTWFLVFQGLIFGAFFQALGLFEPSKLPDPLHAKLLVVALALLCLLGAGSALVAASAVAAAYAQIDAIRSWWGRQNPDGGDFPRLMGASGMAVWSFKLSGATFLRASAAVWLLLLAMLLWGAWR